MYLTFCRLLCLFQVDWVEGVAIIVAIMVVVLVGSLNDWQKERQFQVLNAKKEDRAVKVCFRYIFPSSSDLGISLVLMGQVELTHVPL